MNTSMRGYTRNAPRKAMAGSRYSQPFQLLLSIARLPEPDPLPGILGKQQDLVGL